MTRLRRRTLLQLGGASLLGGTASCAALRRSPPEIGSLRVENHVPEPVVVQVLVTHDSEPVYWEAERVPADASDDETLRVAFDGLPATPGEFVLHARTQAQPPTAWETLESREFDADCLSFIVEVGDPSGGETAEDVSIFYSTNARGCERDATGTSTAPPANDPEQ